MSRTGLREGFTALHAFAKRPQVMTRQRPTHRHHVHNTIPGSSSNHIVCCKTGQGNEGKVL